MPRALEGKVAVVTGASRGIGKQTCLALGALGASVVLAARTEEPRARTPGTLHETAAAIRAAGGNALVVPADLARPDDVAALIARTLEHHGHVDVLVNNAAYTVGKALWAHVPDVTREQWEKGFTVNVTAPLLLIQGFWESMRTRGGGVVVNVTSGAANLQGLDETVHLPGSTLPSEGPLYGASKAALNRMANVIAGEGAPHRIAVVNVEPGFVLTETMEQTFRAEGVDAASTGAISATIPARVIAHLCTCDDPMQYSGRIVSAPELFDEEFGAP
ncbi:MAG TPA: SDR family oxidoreductase [Acidimicrobiia bacterium]|nr:SDR family oxidoreductase [Acidimicrobiia bacterium]